MHSRGLIHYLIRDGLLDQITADGIPFHVQNNCLFTDYLVKQNLITSHDLLQYCAKIFTLPIYDLDQFDINKLHLSPIEPELINHYRILPLHQDIGSLLLGITDPTDHAMMAKIEFHTGLRVEMKLVDATKLDKIIQQMNSHYALPTKFESTIAKILPIKEHKEEIEHESSEPIIKLVQQLIDEAIEKQISDIHIEPFEQSCRIRFRRDGQLYEVANLPLHIAERVITRLKIMGLLNIAEKRLPQDGRITWQQTNITDTKFDIRINSCPTLFGEKIVLRILNTKNTYLDINQIGLNPLQKELFLQQLAEPQGLILVTGPTGSGKTMTLYSALHYLNQIEKNISSVEDPIEIELNGINQVAINPKIGLDFATVLRTFLRQDPDIIMVGEIRDAETAQIAMQASQTGHLVLSTLHTNSAWEAIIRLQMMGIPAYHLIQSISLILAQRLVRKLCEHCKQVEQLPTSYLDHLNCYTRGTFYRPQGCEHCHQGYRGRIGIFELLPMSASLKQVILSGNGIYKISESANEEKWVSLWESGLEKAQQGMTSLAEIFRVIGTKASPA